jgi:hypothetical protein
MIKRSLNYWSQETCLSALLVVTVVRFFALTPVTGGGVIIGLVADVILSLFLLAGGIAMSRYRLYRFSFGAFVVLSIIIRAARALFNLDILNAWDFILGTITILVVLIIILRMVYQEGPVSGHRIRGAIAAYLLVGVLFGKIYGLIYYLVPGAFNIASTIDQSLEVIGEALFYFSVVTLTTVGYGDITPAAPLARSFVMCEAFIGPLYPAILIARLVSLSLVGKMENKG